jgi:hypothetical protein
MISLPPIATLRLIGAAVALAAAVGADLVLDPRSEGNLAGGSSPIWRFLFASQSPA